MACPFSKESLTQLKSFVDICQTNPDILHIPDLAFFKEFIETLGGKLGDPKPMPKKHDLPKEGIPQEEEIESDAESELEFDMEGCLESDEISSTQLMGDIDIETTEEDADKADELRGQAMGQFSNGNFDNAVELYTEAIQLNPQSAILFTKRGQAYLMLKKPNACIKDCTKALELNCDSAQAYKFRGRAFRLLGEWEKAARDLRQACKIDLDEQADEWLKEVQPNALKIEQHNLKQERKKFEREEKERLDRIRMAREAHAKAAESCSEPSAGETGMPGGAGMSDFYKLMQDPEIITAFQDPEVAAAFQDISTNPANIMKYRSNPKVQALIEKLSTKFSGGGMGGFPGFGGGFPGAGTFPGGFPGNNETSPPQDDGLD